MKTKILTLLVCTFILSACEDNSNLTEVESSQDDMVAFNHSTPIGESFGNSKLTSAFYDVSGASGSTNYDQSIASNGQPRQSDEESSVTRKIIKNGSLMFETESLVKTRQAIQAATEISGGYISSENNSNDDYRASATIQVRIPSIEFDNFLDLISKNVKKFDERDISTQDVTEQFVDVKARITSKKRVEQRYLEILKTAKSVKEILEVEAKIGTIREEIERAEGRLKYLKDRTGMSTITIDFYQEITTETAQEENSFFSELGESLTFGLDILRRLFLGLIRIWPLLIIAAIGIFIYRYTNRTAKT